MSFGQRPRSNYFGLYAGVSGLGVPFMAWGFGGLRIGFRV